MKRLRLSEIETIKNTPITKDLFDLDSFNSDLKPITENKNTESVLDNYLLYLEQLRLSYVETNDRIYLDTLCTMLPNTYKLVNLRQSPDYVKNAVKNGMIKILIN